jgi:hypothetical protein
VVDGHVHLHLQLQLQLHLHLHLHRQMEERRGATSANDHPSPPEHTLHLRHP